jgi:hypothetical protein
MVANITGIKCFQVQTKCIFKVEEGMVLTSEFETQIIFQGEFSELMKNEVFVSHF